MIYPFLVNQTGAVTDDMVRTHGEGRQGDGERQGAGVTVVVSVSVCIVTYCEICSQRTRLD